MIKQKANEIEQEREHILNYANQNGFIIKPYNFFVEATYKGIYGIYANDKLVYIGQSKDVLKRYKAHMTHIINNKSEEDKCWKYDMLRFLKENGFVISFQQIADVGLEENLDTVEIALISNLQPLLNIAHRN